MFTVTLDQISLDHCCLIVHMVSSGGSTVPCITKEAAIDGPHTGHSHKDRHDPGGTRNHSLREGLKTVLLMRILKTKKQQQNKTGDQHLSVHQCIINKGVLLGRHVH